jgi:hypothetical protein
MCAGLNPLPAHDDAESCRDSVDPRVSSLPLKARDLMVVYAPARATLKKQNMSLQAHAGLLETTATSLATNTAEHRDEHANIASHRSPRYDHIATHSYKRLGADVLQNNIANYFDGPSVRAGHRDVRCLRKLVTLFDSATADSMS